MKLQKQMSSFDFVLMLVFQSRILERIQITSKTLQRSDVNLDDAKNLLQKCLKTLSELRGEFDDVLDQASKLAAKWNIDSSITSKRKRKVKTFFDELSSDYEFSDPVHCFKVKVFLRAVDILISQLNERFKSMVCITDTFSFLNQDNLLHFSDKQLVKSASEFYKKYESDVTHALTNEVICFRNVVKDDIKSNKISKISHLADYPLIRNKFIALSVPNVSTALIMFLILPVTVASSERTFSKLKIIKNYLRNSMSNTRLCDLSVISIEHERARSLDKVRRSVNPKFDVRLLKNQNTEQSVKRYIKNNYNTVIQSDVMDQEIEKLHTVSQDIRSTLHKPLGPHIARVTANLA
uniref:Uncharacterized protein LOC114342035 n=1 Tax=Diabrotica virgifera virgifera TaxID=50390 RepID=A0A6P7GG18_DIAVI